MEFKELNTARSEERPGTTIKKARPWVKFPHFAFLLLSIDSQSKEKYLKLLPVYTFLFRG